MLRNSPRWARALVALALCSASDGLVRPTSAQEQPETQTSDPLLRVEDAKRELGALGLQPDAAREVELRCRVGDALTAAEDLTGARAAYDQALELARTLGGADVVSRSLKGVAITAQRQSEYDVARDAYEELLALVQAEGDEQAAGAAWNNLGVLHQSHGEIEAAIEAYTQSLEIESPDGMRRVRVLNNVATLCNDLGQHERALKYLERSREAFESTGRGTTHYRILTNQGVAYHGLEELDRARECFDEALALQRAAGDRRSIANTQTNLSEVQFEQGDTSEAIETVQASIAIYEDLGLAAQAAIARQSLAVFLSAEERLAEAERQATIGLQGSQAFVLPKHQIEAQRTLSTILERTNRPVAALSMLRAAEAMEEEAFSPASIEVATNFHTAFERRDLELTLEEAQSKHAVRLVFLGYAAIATLILALIFMLRRNQDAAVRGSAPAAAEGYVSMCSGCKSVRNDHGEWHTIEEFVWRRNKLAVSHGICPECMRDTLAGG